MAKILIVEDDFDLCETYRELLEGHGHSVMCASRVIEAAQLMITEQPNIITLDLNLPGSSSASIINFMRAAKIGKSKVIVISGHPEIINGAEWVDYIDLVLTKPVDNHQLSLMVERLDGKGTKR